MSIEKLKNVFMNALNISEEEVVDKLAYAQHKKWDSTAHMILIAELESAFNIMLDTDDIIDMSSFKVAKEILAKYDVVF